MTQKVKTLTQTHCKDFKSVAGICWSVWISNAVIWKGFDTSEALGEEAEVTAHGVTSSLAFLRSAW